MIEIENLVVAFGGVSAVSNLTVRLDAPVTGMIGPNGAGKTTVLNVLSGFVRPAQGTVKVDGTDILSITTYRRSAFGIRRTFQTEQVVLNLSVWDNVAAILDHVPHGPKSRDEIIRHDARVCRPPGPATSIGRRAFRQRSPHGRDRPRHGRIAAPHHDG